MLGLLEGCELGSVDGRDEGTEDLLGAPEGTELELGSDDALGTKLGLGERLGRRGVVLSCIMSTTRTKTLRLTLAVTGRWDLLQFQRTRK